MAASNAMEWQEFMDRGSPAWSGLVDASLCDPLPFEQILRDAIPSREEIQEVLSKLEADPRPEVKQLVAKLE